jgi:hypothetical protein
MLDKRRELHPHDSGEAELYVISEPQRKTMFKNSIHTFSWA